MSFFSYWYVLYHTINFYFPEGSFVTLSRSLSLLHLNLPWLLFDPPSLSKWCLQWPKLKHWPPPLNSNSSSSHSNFLSPSLQVSSNSSTHQSLAKDKLWNLLLETSFQNLMFQILSGPLLPSSATNNDKILAKSKQFSYKMKIYHCPSFWWDI